MSNRAYNFQPQLKVGCYHIAKAAKLQVRKVSVNDLLRNWTPLNPGKTLTMDDAYYAECREDGTIIWETTKIYTSSELVKRNNVFLIAPKQLNKAV